MKKILGLAAAALLLSIGAASAAATKVTISVAGYSCTFSVYKLADSGNSVGRVLLAASDPNTCQFIGAGDVGRVKTLANTATIVGTSGLLPGYTVMTVLDYPFVSGGTYLAYFTTDGKSLTFIGKGNYTVQ